MCAGDDHNCPQFEQHRQKLLDGLDAERRSFLKSAFAREAAVRPPYGRRAALWCPRLRHNRAPASRPIITCRRRLTRCVGSFSKLLKPQLEVNSGDFVCHRGPDPPCQRRRRTHGAEGEIRRRERVPVDQGPKRRQPPRRRTDRRQATRPRRGEGLEVHICTGPVYIRGAEPGDILEVRIINVKPRPCGNPAYAGKYVRQQRGRVVGLPLQRTNHRAETARGHHHLRD